MLKTLKFAAISALAINIGLFILKLTIGIISNSIAVISEALNSLTDIVSSLAIMFGVLVSAQQPDKKHQFGHSAAQPLAAFIVAVFAGVLGFNIIIESLKRIIFPQEINIDCYVYGVLAITIIIKFSMFIYQMRISKKYSSPAVKAQAIDSINDVLASSIALLGVLASKRGYLIFDPIAGIFVSYFILKSGYDIAKENIDYLMGKSADEELLKKISSIALRVKGVKGLNDLRSYYVGNKFHIEIHIEVSKNETIENSHSIGKMVQYSIEDLKEVQKAFVHIDPV